MAKTILTVEHDENLVGGEYMALHLLELEGVEAVQVEEEG